MAAHCFGITAITSVLSEYLDVVIEIKLYQTCSTVYSGNKEHRDVLKNLREHYWGTSVLPTLQRAKGQGTWEGPSNVTPLYRVCWEIRLEELYDRHPNLMPSVDDDCWESD